MSTISSGSAFVMLNYFRMLAPTFKFQSSRSKSLLQNILSTVRSSNIISRLASDPTLRFWNTYQVETDEHDRELFEKYNGSMDTGLIFVSFYFTILHRS